MKKSVLFLLIVLVMHPLLAEDFDNSMAAISLSNSILDSKILNNPSSTMNLASGDVNLPFNLASLPGKNNFNISLNATYNSNIASQVVSNNLISPTGIMGLGWSLPITKIIVDHKNTVCKMDNDYYLISNGSSIKLLVESINTTQPEYIFVLENDINSKIYYYTDIEKWVIFDGNGNTKVFGENNDAVEWTIAWGNWIGESSIGADQHRVATGWLLSEVSDTWNNYISYTYVHDAELVKNGFYSYTQASYLSSISNNLGYSIQLNYLDPEDEGGKEDFEFQDPHIEASEPDAYQEHYKKKLLDNIELYNDTVLLQVIILDYTDETTGNVSYINENTNGMEKRLLQSIVKNSADNEILDKTDFTYFTSGNYLGYLEKIQLYNGAEITYNYQIENNPYSNQILSWSNTDGLEPPASNYNKNKVYVHNNYAIVIWKEDERENGREFIKVYAYYWDGRWVKSGLLATIYGIEHFDEDVGLVMENDFFAILNYKRYEHRARDLYIFTLNSKINEWIVTDYDLQFNDYNENKAKIISGNDFIAITGMETGMIFRYTKRNLNWIEEVLNSPSWFTSSNDDDDFNISGSNNFFMFHRTDGTDQQRFYYIDELLNWHYFDLGADLILHCDANQSSPITAGNDFLAALANGEHDFIYRWDEGFTNMTKFNMGDTGNNTGLSVIGNTISISNSDKTRAYRYNGSTWVSKTDFVRKSGYTSSAASSDVILRSNRLTTEWFKFWIYNPNDNSWEIPPGYNITCATDEDPYSRAGSNLLTTKLFGGSTGYVFYPESNGWNLKILSNFNSVTYFTSGYNYYAYVKDGSIDNTFIGIKKLNGTWANEIQLTDEQIFYIDNKGVNSIGNSIFFTRDPDDENHLKLYKVVDDKVSGTLSKIVVSSINVNNGYSVELTEFSYNYPKHGTCQAFLDTLVV
ncbi:MAG: hypothetical protein K9G38_06430 [Bacteroidales bacterium]|nr:hypothetical protein [Bacteroidales bacterium]